MKSMTSLLGGGGALFVLWMLAQTFLSSGAPNPYGQQPYGQYGQQPSAYPPYATNNYPSSQGWQLPGGLQLPNNIQLPGGFQLPNLNGGGYTNYNGRQGYGQAAGNGSESIRVGSFNIQDFGESKVRKPEAMELLVRIGRQFDVLAIQEIQSKQYDVVALYVDALNADGSQYDYVIGPRVGRSSQKEQFAYIFDRRSIEVDRNALYTIDDPQDLLAREPLVGWFRVRGPDPREAFTFTLIAVHTDPDTAVQEVNVLDQVFRAVRDDSRREDDVIILGDFNIHDGNLGKLAQLPGAVTAITSYKTMVRGNNRNDNLLFCLPATREFTGRAGVFDYLRDYNLSEQQALLVSDHLPIWAEFSVYEGGRPGQVAAPQYAPQYNYTPQYQQPAYPYR